MNMMKRVLALLLVLAMLMPNFTTIALAAETEDLSVISTEPTVVTEETEPPTEETEPPTEETEPPTEETEPPTEQTEPPTEQTEPPTEQTEPPTEQTEPPTEQTEPPTEQTEPPTVQTEPSGGEIFTGPVETVTVTTEAMVSLEDFPDAEELFAAYVEQKFYGYEFSTMGLSAGSRLPKHQFELYSYLKGQLSEIAKGKVQSTVFTISTEMLTQWGFTTSYSGEDLGDIPIVEVIDGTGYITQTAIQAFSERFDSQLNLDVVINALMYDSPYEQFWFGKKYLRDYEIAANTSHIWISEGGLSIELKVSADYQSGNDTTVNSSLLGSVTDAVDNAADILAKYEDVGDFEKLTAYKDKICDLVSYDHDAADHNTFGEESDPWQLIYVFDGDSDTNVVCEGYAKAFQYLCDMTTFQGDVQCASVIGYADGPHMWNIVSIDGRNYLVDVTNTDESEIEGQVSFGQGSDILFLGGAAGSISEGYRVENPDLDPSTMTYEYYFDTTYVDQTTGEAITKEIHPSVDVYGDDEESILNLSDISYAEYRNQQQEDSVREEIITQPETIDNLTVGYGEKLIIKGTEVTITGESKLEGGFIELVDGARLTVEGDLLIQGYYDEEKNEDCLSVLQLNEGTELLISADDQGNPAGRISVRAYGHLNNFEGTVSVPDGTIVVEYNNGSQIDVPEQAQLIEADIYNETVLAEVAAMLEDHPYGGAELHVHWDLTLHQNIVLRGEKVRLILQKEEHNDGDRVTLTVAQDGELTLGGCYAAVHGGTEISVEGTLNDYGYLDIFEAGRLICKDSGWVNVLNNGSIHNNGGEIYLAAPDHLITEQEGSNPGWLEGNEPVHTDPHITLRFLSNRGNGWFEEENSERYRSIRVSPDQNMFLIAYLNQWDDNRGDWEISAIPADKLVSDGNLVLEPFPMIQDGNNHTEENQNFPCFFRLRAADGVLDETDAIVEAKITYSNTDLQARVEIGRHPGGFYRENPLAEGADVDKIWLNELRVSDDMDTVWFFYDGSKDFETGWSVSNLTLEDPGQAVLEKMQDNLWKITISKDYTDNIYALREFHLNLRYELVKADREPRQEHAGLWCCAGEFGHPNASFVINGERYSASYGYDGFFQFVSDGEGGMYPVPAEVQGVSYDIEQNTMTLENAHLESLEISNQWYDPEKDEGGANLPHGYFRLNLKGTNTIFATDRHALLVQGNMCLDITGDGALDITLAGDRNNTCHSAFEVNDADVTIEGNAKVTVNVSGVGYYEDENGRHRADLAAFRIHGNNRNLWLNQDAELTTTVPAGACINGYFAADGSFREEGGFHGLQVPNLEINENARLNTQTFRVWDEGLDKGFGRFTMNGGTVTVSGIPYYNKDERNENGTQGHYHFGGVEADYGQIDINGGVLNINMTATPEQMAKSVYYHALQSRGRHIGLNGGEINVTGNFSGTGIKVGEDDWNGGTNAWMDFNGATLNMTGSNLYRNAVDIAPNGSVNFNGGRILAHRADVTVRGQMNWNGTELNATECGLLVVNGGKGDIHGGWMNIRDGGFIVDNAYDDKGNLVHRSGLNVHNGYLELDNSFLYANGDLSMEGGVIDLSLDYRTLTTDAKRVYAFEIGKHGAVKLSREAYVEIEGKGETDGICNDGTLEINGASVIVDTEETVYGTFGLRGAGANRFKSGFLYLDGYTGLAQFNENERSGLTVGGDMQMNVFGHGAGIVTYAPVKLEGGRVNAYTVGDLAEEQTYAVVVENNEGTNARLDITGGNHYFGSLYEDDIPETNVGLGIFDASVSFTGGSVIIEAQMAVYNKTNGEPDFQVPFILNSETGHEAMLEKTADGFYTLMDGENHAAKVGFLTSQTCGENVQWHLDEQGVLTISVMDSAQEGIMANYHMPARDPASWRTAPWYAAAESITKVVVEAGVTHIGDWAFGRLPNVTEIVYPATVERIDMTSSYDCPNLEKFTISGESVEGQVYTISDEGKVLIENGELVRAAVRGITSYTADDHVTTIGMGAFDSTNLKELDLNKVQVIQNYAFADCQNLKSVVIPEGVTTIEMTVFQGSGLESITIPASVTKIRNYAFDGCSELADVFYTGTEAQWNDIAIGSGNNALTSLPITFVAAPEAEAEGQPYLSYRLVKHDGSGYYEDVVSDRETIKLLNDYDLSLTVYLNTWNAEKKIWEHRIVDPNALKSRDGVVDIFQFRSQEYTMNQVAEGEPNGEYFIELSLKETKDDAICYRYQDQLLELAITADYHKAGFYSQNVDLSDKASLKNYAQGCFRINPNSQNSIYFGVADSDITVTAVTVTGKTGFGEWLTEDDLQAVALTQDTYNGNLWKIDIVDPLADKVYEYAGFELYLQYTYGAGETEIVVLECYPVALRMDEVTGFHVDGRYYEAFPGVEGFFWWDEENQVRQGFESIPAGTGKITYDYDTDTLTMENAAIQTLHLQHTWYDEQRQEGGISHRDSDLTLKLVGKNQIISSGSESPLYVGGGLELTITAEEEDAGSLTICAANEGQGYSHNAVNVNDGASLVISGYADVTVSVKGNEYTKDDHLMGMWGGGNNTLVITDHASLTTDSPDFVSDNGYEGIGWFGEIRVEKDAKLNTTTLGLGQYKDENGIFRGSGSFIQTGGTATIEALGHRNPDGSVNYTGFRISGGTAAFLYGGQMIIQAPEGAAEQENYNWFNGIWAEGHLEIGVNPDYPPREELGPVAEKALVEIEIPGNGTGMSVAGTQVHTFVGAEVQITGGGEDNHGLIVDGHGNFQLHEGLVELTNARVTLGTQEHGPGYMDVYNGTLSVSAKNTPHSGLDVHPDSNLTLHNGSIVVDKGMTTGIGDAVSIRGNMDLHGGTMRVTGGSALAVRDGGCLNQHNATLNLTGLENTLSADNGGSIYLNGGESNITMGDQNTVANHWYSAVHIDQNGYLEVNDGEHTIQVKATPGKDREDRDIWLCALDVRGYASFRGGVMHLDAGTGGTALINREVGEGTIGFENGMGAIASEGGIHLFMRNHNDGNYTLGMDDGAPVSAAKIQNVSAGWKSSWRIERNDQGDVLLIISGQENMDNYYMPGQESDSWIKTPWYRYKDQITHVILEDGIDQNGIKHIGDWAFAYMTGLKHVVIPRSVESISGSAFFGCTSLEDFCMQGNNNFHLDENTCGEYDENGYRVGTVIIEGGWKILKAAATVENYTVPHYISEIGNGAFQNCTELTSVEFERNDGYCNLWNIGNNAFEKTGLTEIVIPDGVKSIGRFAFANCASLQKISLPDSLNTIRPYAFYDCGQVEVIYAGTETNWEKIAIGDGNTFAKVICDPGAGEGPAYLSFRWLEMDEEGCWRESSEPTTENLSMAADMTFYGVFYYNHWDGEKWVAEAVVPTSADAKVVSIQTIENQLADSDWKIADGETNGAKFVTLTTAPGTWDDESLNPENGTVSYSIDSEASVCMNIDIKRNSYGFYSSPAASNAAWLNAYEMNPLKQTNEFYFIYEGSGDKMDDSSFRLWNYNGIPDHAFKKYAVSPGVFRIVLDPVFMQDAWRSGGGFRLHAGFDVTDSNGDNRHYVETDFQLQTLDLGRADAIIEINGRQYLYFAEQNGWMTYGDPANEGRPGVVMAPGGVSYDLEHHTLTLNNAYLNSLSLRHLIYDEEGRPTGEKHLPKADLTLVLSGNNTIETGHRTALNIGGGLNVTVTGEGKLRLHSHNSPDNHDEHGNQYAFDTLVVEQDSTLTIAGGEVTAEISGEGYWSNGNPAMPAAIRGRHNGNLVIKGGILKTRVPDNARDNGPGEVDFEEYYGTHAISEVKSITVEGGVLDTQTLYLSQGETYTQSGGTVNITGMGYLSWQWDEYGNQYQNRHHNGIQLNQGAEANITGGALNLTVTPEWEYGGSFNGLSLAGGMAKISGDANITVLGTYHGSAIWVGYDHDDQGNRFCGTLLMEGGSLAAKNRNEGYYMNSLTVEEGCNANISGGVLNPAQENQFVGIRNMGILTIGGDAAIDQDFISNSGKLTLGKATVNVGQSVYSDGELIINGAEITVKHPKDADMYAWDIVPGTVFNFTSGTITAENAAFMISGMMDIGEEAKLILTDSEFHADGLVNLNGNLTMHQEKPVDNRFIRTEYNEWGEPWDLYEYQSRLYVNGCLNLNSGALTLENVPMNIEGSAVVNQNGTTVSIINATAAKEVRENDDADSNDWMASVHVNPDATLNINGGSVTMNNTGFNTGMEVNGMLNLRGGELNITNPDGVALAASGLTNVSGSEENTKLILNGWVGYEQSYFAGDEEQGIPPTDHGKLTISGGTVDIDAANTGIDLYNNMVITGGKIDIHISGDQRYYTDEKGVPMDVLAGCGIMAYNDTRKISVSINGGTLNIDVPNVDVEEGKAISSYGILGSRNSTIRINGGNIDIQARAALYAEAPEDNAKHIIINNRLHVLSPETGNTLDLTSGVVNVEENGETWYGNTYAEDGIFATPFNNFHMDGYAQHLQIVSKSAGGNTFWDLDNGTLTITSSGEGAMDDSAVWFHLRDKVTRLEVGLNIDHPANVGEWFVNLKSVKAPHGSNAEAYAEANDLSFEPVHELVTVDGVEKCSYENCEYASVQSIVKNDALDAQQKVKAIQKIETEELKNEMQQDSTVVEHIAELEKEVQKTLEVAVEPNQNAPIQKADITGAALNATEDTKKVALVIADTNVQPAFKEEDYESALRFSMDLQTTSTNGTTDTLTTLNVPVEITIPLPADMDVNRLEILHYHDETKPPEQVPFTSKVEDGVTYVSFVLSGFSDIELLQQQRALQVKLVDEAIAYGDTPKLNYEIYENGEKVDLPEGYTVQTSVNQKARGSDLTPGIYTTTAVVKNPDGGNIKFEIVEGALTVSKQIYTVTMDSKTLSVGENLPELTYTVQNQKGEAAELPMTLTPYVKGIEHGAPITKGGEYVITAQQPVETTAYQVKIVSGTLTVNRQKVVVTMGEDQKTTLGSDFQPVYTVTLNGEEIQDHGLQIVPSGYNLERVGAYPITANVVPNDRYEAETVNSGTLTVIREVEAIIADVTIASDDKLPETFTYSVPRGLEKAVTLENFQITDAEGEPADPRVPGVYSITAEVVNEPEYHEVTVKSGKLTVIQTVTVTVQNTTLTSEKAPEFGFDVDIDGVDASTIKLGYWIEDATGRTITEITEGKLEKAITAGGQYTICAEVLNAGHYSIAEVKPGVLTVVQDVAVTVLDAEMKLGENLPEFTFTADPDSVAKDIELTYQVGEINSVGEYSITADVNAPEYYKITVNPGKLTVTQDIAVTISDAAITSGDPIPTTFAYTTSPDVEVKLTFTVKDGDGNVITDTRIPGEYVITATPTEGENPFYHITVADATLTVEHLAKLAAMAVSAEGEVQLIMRMTFAEKLLNDDAATLIVTEEANRITKVDQVTTYTMSEIRTWKRDDNGRYAIRTGLASGEMTGDVTIQIKDSKGDFVYIADYKSDKIDTKVTRTAIDYVRLALGTSDEPLKNLMTAMVTYGGYAQTYYKTDADNPAYAVLSEFDLQIPNISEVTADTIGEELSAAGENIGISYKNQKLGLDSSIYMSSLFILDSGAVIEDYAFELTYTENHVEKTKTVTPVQDGEGYRIIIEDIPAAYLDYMYKITVTKIATGEAYTLTSSVTAWIKRCLNASTQPDDLKDMARAMYLYNQAANAYFKK